MPTETVTGDDTLVLNDNVFNDLADNDTTALEFPNELVNITTGKNGNGLIALNQKGFNGTLKMRLNRGSSDDQFMATQLTTMSGNFSGTKLLAGSFTKRIGDGSGNFVSDVYNLSGGVVSRIPAGKENVSGDTEQAVVVYEVKFTRVTRGIE